LVAVRQGMGVNHDAIDDGSVAALQISNHELSIFQLRNHAVAPGQRRIRNAQLIAAVPPNRDLALDQRKRGSLRRTGATDNSGIHEQQPWHWFSTLAAVCARAAFINRGAHAALTFGLANFPESTSRALRPSAGSLPSCYETSG